jgi:D-aminoacyl-tRNA deacylase
MYLVVACKEDLASMNICRFLVESANWREGGEFEGNAVLRLKDRAVLVTINDSHLYSDNIDTRVSKALDMEVPWTVIFLSRHKSESGLRTLTVHPLGCYGRPDFGGRDRTFVPSAPGPMTGALRLIKEKAKAEELDFKVSFECSHHGPYLESPTFFIEIGSSEDAWVEEPPARVLASVVREIILEEDDVGKDVPVALGMGGGHYAPRFTDVALARKVYFGHMLPNYAIKDSTNQVLEETMRKTPEAKLVYFHRKALKGHEYRRLKDVFTSLGLEAVREKDLEKL